MKKSTKIIITVIAIVVAIAVVIALGYYYWVKTEYQPEPDLDLPTISGNNMSDIEIKDSEQEDPYAELDRTPKFETTAPLGKKDVIIVSENATEEEIQEASDTIGDLLYSGIGAYLNENAEGIGGFIAQPSANITPYNGPMYRTECVGIDGSEVYISQYSKDVLQLDELWKDILRTYAFDYYLGYEPKGLTGKENYTLGQGLEDYANYFGVAVTKDPTVVEDMQLIIDKEIDTNYGTGKLLVFYQFSYDRYMAKSIIDAGDRLICIDVTTFDLSYVEPYIQEACMSVITILR